MKKIKVLLSVLFAFVLTFTLVGCSLSINSGNEYVEETISDYASAQELIEMAKKNTKKESGTVEVINKGTPNFNVPAGGYDGSEVTIVFYHTMGSNLSDVLHLYIEDFNAIYPNIHIDDQQVGGYDDVRNTISLNITVGAQPNIAYCYPDHVAVYNLANAVAHLDNLIDSTESDGNGGIIGLTQEQKDNFIEGYYNEGKQFGDGLMYTMPFSKSTEVLYYNKTFFTEHSIPVPDHWFSTDENDTTSMEAVCKKILEADPNCIPLGYDSEANWFITMCEQIGTDYTSADPSNHFLFDNKYNKGFVKIFRDWFKKGYVTTQQLQGKYTSALFTAEKGTKSYMSIGSSAGATHQRPSKIDGTDTYPFEVGIVSIPQMNAENPRVISQGPSVCIFAKENPQEVIASWLFVKFLTTSVEFQAEFSMVSGYVPVLKNVSSNAVYKAFLDNADGYEYIAALSAKVCLEQQEAYYTSPAFNGSSKARDQVGLLISTIFSNDPKNLKEFIDDKFAKAVKTCKQG